MPRLSLTTKLVASYIAILLPVLLLLLYGYRDANERRVESILDSQMQTAQAVGALVDASFNEALTLGWALANDPLVQTFDPSQLDPYIQRLAPAYPQFDVIAVSDAEGVDVGRSPPYPSGAPRVRVADRAYFQQLMATGRAVVGPVVIGRATARPTVSTAVPIRDAEGKTVGAVFVALYLEGLSRRLEAVTLGPDQRISLVDMTGTVAFNTGKPDLPWEQRNLAEFEPILAALEGRPRRLRHYISPLSGDARIGAYAPSPKYGWVVGVSVPEDLALASVMTALRDQLLGFGGVVTLSLALILLASHSLLQPIRRLTGHARALGQGDLRRRVTIRTGDELETLGETFNQMAERLERTMGEVRAALEIREEFIAASAHELRGPAAGIRTNIELIRKLPNGRSPAFDRALQAIESSTDRISRLARELIQSADLDRGALRLQPEPLDLAELAGEAVRQVEAEHPSYHIRLEAAPAVVAADRRRIIEVICHLVENAVKYQPAGGEIDVAVRAERDEAVLCVRDHGFGIAPERQSHVFEPMYEPVPPGLPGYAGVVGLGLALSKRVIELHDGRIWVESQPGRGSTFRFALPLIHASEGKTDHGESNWPDNGVDRRG